MKDLKPVAWMLLRFLAVYAGLLYVYQKYLHLYSKNTIDPYSKTIANQANQIMNAMGYQSQLVYSAQKNGLYFYTNQKYITIMIEGCNALSVMILFLAFVIAFYSSFKKTAAFSLISLLFLYVVNLFRIVALNLIALKYPRQMTIAHDLFFPAIIYGAVIVLWLVWVQCFVKKK